MYTTMLNANAEALGIAYIEFRSNRPTLSQLPMSDVHRPPIAFYDEYNRRVPQDKVCSLMESNIEFSEHIRSLSDQLSEEHDCIPYPVILNTKTGVITQFNLMLRDQEDMVTGVAYTLNKLQELNAKRLSFHYSGKRRNGDWAKAEVTVVDMNNEFIDGDVCKNTLEQTLRMIADAHFDKDQTQQLADGRIDIDLITGEIKMAHQHYHSTTLDPVTFSFTNESHDCYSVIRKIKSQLEDRDVIRFVYDIKGDTNDSTDLLLFTQNEHNKLQKKEINSHVDTRTIKNETASLLAQLLHTAAPDWTAGLYKGGEFKKGQGGFGKMDVYLNNGHIEIDHYQQELKSSHQMHQTLVSELILYDPVVDGPLEGLSIIREEMPFSLPHYAPMGT